MDKILDLIRVLTGLFFVIFGISQLSVEPIAAAIFLMGGLILEFMPDKGG